MTNPLMLQDVDNELLRDADEYLRKHKILELFEVRPYNAIHNQSSSFRY